MSMVKHQSSLQRGVATRLQPFYLPTVSFAIDYVVPDEMFTKAAQVIAGINVREKEVKILSELPKPEAKKS